MSDAFHEFTERLKTLLSENPSAGDTRQEISSSPPEITLIRQADGADVVLEIHAACHGDPVRRPDDLDEVEPGAAGPWDRREVTLVVTLPCDTGECVTAKLSFATKNADHAGSRLVSFHWRFNAAGKPGLAEMSFHDSKTFKLDYFSVPPPNYVRSFVALCVRAYRETRSAQIGDRSNAPRKLTQPPGVPSFKYPLYAVCTRQKCFFCRETRSPRDGSQIAAIIICTQRAIAEAYIADMGIDAVAAQLADKGGLYGLLSEQNPPIVGVALNPRVKRGRVFMDWVGEIDDVLESLSDPGFMWSYPVFAIGVGQGRFATVGGRASLEGAPVAIPIFTDEDLAERFMEARHISGELHTVSDQWAFADLLRSQADVEAVCFDMVATQGGVRSKAGRHIGDMLKRLEPPK
jgi:hypothetical protein